MTATPTRQELDDFIRKNDVDERAANDLRDCSAEIQRKVLARGELSTARNPSAALLARIRDARAATSSVSGGTGAGGAAASTADVEEFIRHNDVDESAADTLRSSSPGVQRAVLSRGELKTARNPSSALLARIRDAKMGVVSPPPPGGSSTMALAPYGAVPPACGGFPGGYGGGYGMYPPPPGAAPSAWGYGMYGGYPGAYMGGEGAPFMGAYGGYGNGASAPPAGYGPGGYGGGYPMGGYSGSYGGPPGDHAAPPGEAPPKPARKGRSRSRSRQSRRSRRCSSSSESSSTSSRSRRKRRGRRRRRG